MTVVVEKVAIAWDDISAVTIQHSWQKLLPMSSPAHDPASNSTPKNPTSVNGSTTNNTPNDDSLSDDLSCSDCIQDFAKHGHHLIEAEINGLQQMLTT